MAKNTASVPAKITGSTYTAAEFETVRGFVDSAQQSLGTFIPSSITLDGSGVYSDYTSAGNITFAFTGTPQNGNWHKVKVTLNGSHTLTVPEGSVILNNSFTDGAAPASDTYDLWIAYVGSEYQFNLVERAAKAITLPTITSLTMASDNTYADLLLSEGIYGANDGSTPAALSDLSVVFAQSGGTATGWTASSAKQNDNTVEGSASALVGGETTIRIFGSITGTEDGNETLTVTPADGSSLYDADGNAMDAGESAVGNFAGWTAFNGTTTHIYFGEILRSVFEGADKKFALEIEIKDWDNTGIIRLFSYAGNDETVRNALFAVFIDTAGKIRITYYYSTDGVDGGTVGVESVTAITNSARKIRIEYDGSIDTSGGVDRVAFTSDDTLLGSTSAASSGSWPFDIGQYDTQELAFGSYRQPDGSQLTLHYNGDARNFIIENDTGAGWVQQLNVPDISTGNDISANNNDGTFVS